MLGLFDQMLQTPHVERIRQLRHLQFTHLLDDGIPNLQ